MKNRTLMIAALMTIASVAFAQEETTSLTVFKGFQPGIIYLKDGRSITNPLLNVFLKNSSLLYLHGGQTKEANMDNIVGVDFKNRKYVKMANGELAYLVDTVAVEGKPCNKLYCTTVIDIEAYNQTLRNNVNITNLEMSSVDFAGGNLNYTTIDLEPQDGTILPVINKFYFQYDGKIFPAHEREMHRRIPKDKQRLYKTLMQEDDFSWVSKNSLMRMLQKLSE